MMGWAWCVAQVVVEGQVQVLEYVGELAQLSLHAPLLQLKVGGHPVHEANKAPEGVHLVLHHVEDGRQQVAHTLPSHNKECLLSCRGLFFRFKMLCCLGKKLGSKRHALACAGFFQGGRLQGKWWIRNPLIKFFAIQAENQLKIQLEVEINKHRVKTIHYRLIYHHRK